MTNNIEIIDEAKSKLGALLAPVPFVHGIEMVSAIILEDDRHADFIASMFVGNNEIRLVCEVKKGLQPRFVFDAIRQVKEHCSFLSGTPVYPVVVSEYISPRSAEILIDQNVSYFDLTGNCHLSFANIYIEKVGEKLKSGDRRGVKSLFGLKSSRMLRLMLRNHIRPWQVKELATETELSLGQVSNIRRSLLDQQYATVSRQGGVQLSQPGALLRDWANLYKKNIVKQEGGYYSLLDAEERLDAIKLSMAESLKQGGGIMLNGLSAARWQAPYTKSISDTFYADKKGIEILKRHLLLEPVNVGPNVLIEEPKDSFVFKESVESAPGLKCTNAIQTYLDLYIAGEREQEAAEHVESYLLRDKWKHDTKDEK